MIRFIRDPQPPNTQYKQGMVRDLGTVLNASFIASGDAVDAVEPDQTFPPAQRLLPAGVSQESPVAALTNAEVLTNRALVSADGIPSSVALLGDSYLATANIYSGSILWGVNGQSSAIAMNTLLGGPWDFITDGTLSGQNSAQWISNPGQLPAVVASPAKVALVAFPTNDPDLLAGGADASIANLRTIYGAIAASGKQLIVVNGGSKSTWTGVQRGYAAQISRWISETAAANGWPCIDMMGAIIDPATSVGSTTLLLNESGNFIHPNSLGNLQSAAISLPNFSRVQARPVVTGNTAEQAIFNTMLGGDVSGYPSGLAAYTSGSPTGVTASKVARTDSIRTFARITGTSGVIADRVGMQTASISLNTAWAIGAKALGARAVGTFGDQWVCTTAGTSSGTQPAAMAAASEIGQTVTDAGGVVWTRYKNIVPGVSKLSLRVEFDVTGISGGNGAVQPVLLFNFAGTVPYSGIRANSPIGGESYQRWGFTRSRRPVLVAPYQVPVPAGATGIQLFLYNQFEAVGITASLDVYGIEARID